MSTEFHAASPANQQAPSWQAWLVCLSGAFYFFFEFAQMNMFNAIDGSLMREFSLNAGELGNISAYYFYANLLTLIPAGVILDRLSTRRLLLIVMSLTLMALFGFALAQNVITLKICRFVMGAASSFCFLANVRLASRWFPPKRLALVIGVIVTVAMLGGVSVQTPLTYFTDHYGWRHALMYYMGAMGFAILALLFAFVKDMPEDMRQIVADQKATLHSYGFWHSLARVLKNPQNWLGGLFTSLMNLPILIVGAMWGLPYLVNVFGLSRLEASNITSMIFIGTIIGSPLMGWFSDRIARRTPIMTACAMASLFLILWAMFGEGLNYTSLMMLYLLIGFFTSSQVLSYPVIAESNPPAITATSESLASILIQGGGLTQPLFGWIMGLHWSAFTQYKTVEYTVTDYQHAMILIPVGFFLAIIASLLIKETYARMRPEAEGLDERIGQSK